MLKLSAKYYERSGLVRALVAPGLALQQLTTREPDAGMLEVSIASLKQVLASEGLADEGLADEGLTDEGLTDEVSRTRGRWLLKVAGRQLPIPGRLWPRIWLRVERPWMARPPASKRSWRSK
jgi:hypothetical protein